MSKTKTGRGKGNSGANIQSMLKEERVFKPSKDFSKKAHIGSMAAYKKIYDRSVRQPEAFWNEQAKKELVWFKPWSKVLQWKAPYAKWFVGGQTNVSMNCLDRYLDSTRPIRPP